MATLQHLLSNLSDNDQERGRQFERICKWYLQNEPQYKLQLKKVWLWNDWPDRWGPDTGIDIVAGLIAASCGCFMRLPAVDITDVIGIVAVLVDITVVTGIVAVFLLPCMFRTTHFH